MSVKEMKVKELPIFLRCPSCDSVSISLQILDAGGMREHCPECFFVATYVKFNCTPDKHCNPDVFAICPRKDCPNPGKPSEKQCNRD
jgi:hypothetical protein